MTKEEIKAYIEKKKLAILDDLPIPIRKCDVLEEAKSMDSYRKYRHEQELGKINSDE